MNNPSKNIFRRDFLKGLGAIPFLGYFAVKFKDNMLAEAEFKHKDYLKFLGIETLDAPNLKYIPSAKNTGDPIRLGLIGAGWRGEQLMQSFGFIHGGTGKGKHGEREV